MPPESTTPPESTDLIIPPSTGLVRLPDGGSPALSEIISRTLVHIQTSKNLGTFHRIGEHVMQGPDYRLLCIWGEELHLSPEEVLNCIIECPYNTIKITNGKIKELKIDWGYLEVSGIPFITGLEIEIFGLFRYGYIENNLIKKIDLSAVPNLTELVCFDHAITEIDLKPVPNLKLLNCSNNVISELDLSFVPNLSTLICHNNPLSKIHLTPVSNLTRLDCSNCRLTDLDLASVPKLRHLNCSAFHGQDLDLYNCSSVNSLKELNLKFVQELEELNCSGNPLTNLDLSPVINLKKLQCEFNGLRELDISRIINLRTLVCGNQFSETEIFMMKNVELSKVHIIQRPDQNFI